MHDHHQIGRCLPYRYAQPRHILGQSGLCHRHAILHQHSDEEKPDQHKSDAERHPERKEVYQEGEDVIVENEDGDVIAENIASGASEMEEELKDDIEHPSHGYKNLKKNFILY